MTLTTMSSACVRMLGKGEAGLRTEKDSVSFICVGLSRTDSESVSLFVTFI